MKSLLVRWLSAHGRLRYLVRRFSEGLDHLPGFRKIFAAAVAHYLKHDFCIAEEPLRSNLSSSVRVGLKWLWMFRQRPLMTVLVPVYNTDPVLLRRCIESVMCQIYKNWELCIVDDGSTEPAVRAILEEYTRRDQRVKATFSEQNEGTAATANKAALMASGKYVGVLDHDDELHPLALLEYVRTINEYPDADCIYCDEDKIDEQGNHFDPWFKSDWNPDLILSFNYVMHFVMCRRDLFERLGGFRTAYEGSQDYDLILRLSEATDRIYHIPKVLYHWRIGPGSIASGPEAKDYVFESGIAALTDALRRRGIQGRVEHAPDAWKGVYRVSRAVDRKIKSSVIVAAFEDESGLLRLLESIWPIVSGEDCEVIVCHRTELALDRQRLAEEYGWIQWLPCDSPYTLPRAFNRGARRAKGEVLFFLDETMELLSPESYRYLLEHIQRAEVGAVGGKVYHASGLIEHAGVIFGPFNILGYAHRATPDTPGYVGLKSMICNYSAVMGLGMMTRKKLLLELGGFDERLERNYWDADYCLKLRKRDYLITYTPYTKLVRHVPVKSIEEMIVEPEATLFRSRWQYVINRDPYFNPNLFRGLEDFSFREPMLPSIYGDLF